MGLDLVGLCVSSQKTAISWSRQKRERKKKTEVEVPLGSFCISCNSSRHKKIGRAGGWPQNKGQEQEGGTHCNFHVLFRVPRPKEMLFFFFPSQRGTGDANFISLDPSSFGLQRAGGRKQG